MAFTFYSSWVARLCIPLNISRPIEDCSLNLLCFGNFQHSLELNAREHLLITQLLTDSLSGVTEQVKQPPCVIVMTIGFAYCGIGHYIYIVRFKIRCQRWIEYLIVSELVNRSPIHLPGEIFQQRTNKSDQKEFVQTLCKHFSFIRPVWTSTLSNNNVFVFNNIKTNVLIFNDAVHLGLLNAIRRILSSLLMESKKWYLFNGLNLHILRHQKHRKFIIGRFKSIMRRQIIIMLFVIS